MAKIIKYTGSQDFWPELSITGKQSVWHVGQQELRSESEASLLIATGLFAPANPEAVGPVTRRLQIATRCYAPSAKNGTARQAMTKSMHVKRGRQKSFRLAFPNFYMNSGVEVAVGAPASITAAVEWPVGVFNPITFDGQRTGIIPDGLSLLCDDLSKYVPPGAKFGVTAWRSCAAGIVYTQNFSAIAGDGYVSSTTTTPDLTMGGAITAATVNVYLPIAIVGESEDGAVIGIGDSNGAGATDTNPSTDFCGDIGMMARSLGPVAPYINMASPSDSLSIFLGNTKVNRMAMAQYATDIIWQYGTNDIAGGATAAAVLTNLAACIALFPNHRHHVCTIPPRTTSTDSWATTANQAVLATEAIRVVVNTGIRSGIPGAAGYIDLADAAETSRNSGIFKIDAGSASPAITVEGVHFLSNGQRMIAASGAFPKAVFAVRS